MQLLPRSATTPVLTAGSSFAHTIPVSRPATNATPAKAGGRQGRPYDGEWRVGSTRGGANGGLIVTASVLALTGDEAESGAGCAARTADSLLWAPFCRCERSDVD